MGHGYYLLGDFPRWQVREDVPIGTVGRVAQQLKALKERKGDFGQLREWYGACDGSMVERALTGADVFVVPDMFCNALKYFGYEQGEQRPGAKVFRGMRADRHAAAMGHIDSYRRQLASLKACEGPLRSILELEIISGQLPSFEGDELVIPTDNFLIAPPVLRQPGSARMQFGGIVRVNLTDRSYKLEPFEIDHMEMCDQRYIF